MNKGDKIIYKGEFAKGFTKNREYTVTAGQGDGVPRNDGKLGAFIQNEYQFVIEDDFKHCRLLTIKSGNWRVSHVSEPTYVPKPKYKSPIQLTTSLC